MLNNKLLEIVKENIPKEAVYFVGKSKNTDIKIQEEEIDNYNWLNFKDAYNTLEFDNLKEVLILANEYLIKE